MRYLLYFYLPFILFPLRCRFAVPVVPEWVGVEPDFSEAL